MARANNVRLPARQVTSAPSQYQRSTQAVREVSDRVVVNDKPREGFNGVSILDVDNEGAEQFVNLTLDNSAGATPKLYLVGDPYGIVESASKLTVAIPDSGSIDPAAFQKMCAQKFSISMINYKANVSPAQFDQPFDIVSANSGGRFLREPLNIAGAERPNNFNQKLLKLDVQDRVFLTARQALLIQVADGETVNLSINFGVVGA